MSGAGLKEEARPPKSPPEKVEARKGDKAKQVSDCIPCNPLTIADLRRTTWISVNPQSSTVIFWFRFGVEPMPRRRRARSAAVAFDDHGQSPVPRTAGGGGGAGLSFAQARTLIDELRNTFAVSLVALDQPTVVPIRGQPPRWTKSLGPSVSFCPAVAFKPANRSKIGMFCDDSPIWSFISGLAATEDPIQARTASAGHFP